MDNRANDRSGKGNLLTGRFEIPAWLLILVTIAAILAPVLGVTIPPFVWILITILLLVIGWLRSRPNPSGRTVELSDKNQSEYTLRFSNLPEDVNPRLWEIKNRDKLKELKKDKDVGEVLSVAADIAFYDENKVRVSSFKKPVTLTFNYTDDDKRRLRERTEELIRDKVIASNEEAILIPLYLYSPVFKRKKKLDEVNSEKPDEEIDEASEDQVWMPFQNFTRDDVNQTLTVEFMFWGDGQIGPGTNP